MEVESRQEKGGFAEKERGTREGMIERERKRERERERERERKNSAFERS